MLGRTRRGSESRTASIKIGLFVASALWVCGDCGLLQTPSAPVLGSSIFSPCLAAKAPADPQSEHPLEVLPPRHPEGLTSWELQDGVEDDDAVQSLPANLLVRIPDAKDEPPQQKPERREPRRHLFVS